MFTIKANQTFKKIDTGSRIKILEIFGAADHPRTKVEIMNIFRNGKPMEKSTRTVFQDSIRRWYSR